MASGGNYTCHLVSPAIALLDTYPIPGPYVDLGLQADVTVTPQGIVTLRQATFGGNPGGQRQPHAERDADHRQLGRAPHRW